MTRAYASAGKPDTLLSSYHMKFLTKNHNGTKQKSILPPNIEKLILTTLKFVPTQLFAILSRPELNLIPRSLRFIRVRTHSVIRQVIWKCDMCIFRQPPDGLVDFEIYVCKIFSSFNSGFCRYCYFKH